MTTDTTAADLHTVDALVRRYLDLTDTISELNEARDTVKALLRDLGVGDHKASNGITVKVTPPARRFNLDRAWDLLSPEQQRICVAPSAAKVKAQLPGVLVESCMDDGTGDAAVKVVTR